MKTHESMNGGCSVAAAAVPRPNPKDCDVGSRPGADRQARGLAAVTPPQWGLTVAATPCVRGFAVLRRPFYIQFVLVIALPQRGQSVLPLAQVVPQLEHWLTRRGLTGFTGPQA